MRKNHFVQSTAWLLLLLAGNAAYAGEHVYTATDPAWKTECGSCHVAYPPSLLPASSWRKLMTGLDNHFGSDASLDPAITQSITRFLETNASTRRQHAKETSLRITDSAWFRREHDEVPERIWKSAAVKSLANCTACHMRAEQGDYRERTLRVPQ